MFLRDTMRRWARINRRERSRQDILTFSACQFSYLRAGVRAQVGDDLYAYLSDRIISLTPCDAKTELYCQKSCIQSILAIFKDPSCVGLWTDQEWAILWVSSDNSAVFIEFSDSRLAVFKWLVLYSEHFQCTVQLCHMLQLHPILCALISVGWSLWHDSPHPARDELQSQ